MDSEAFFTLHKDLPREGPGEAADVAWAIRVAGTHGEARVCDVACGPGADTETLAEILPDAWIDAIDRQPGFVRATADRCARFGPRVKAWDGDMQELAGPYDLIWCAGAVYFLGVTEALQCWRPALTRTGCVAFSEPVLIGRDQPREVVEFWEEYPAITDEAGILARVTAAGYRCLGTRLVLGAPWAAYYGPQKERIETLRQGNVTDSLGEVLDAAEAEIAGWEAVPERIAYLLLVVAPE